MGWQVMFRCNRTITLLSDEQYETDLLPVVKKYQVGVIPYFSLAAGFLTGKYRSQQDTEKAARGAMVQKYLNDWGFGVVAALDEVANAQTIDPSPCGVGLVDCAARNYVSNRQRDE